MNARRVAMRQTNESRTIVRQISENRVYDENADVDSRVGTKYECIFDWVSELERLCVRVWVCVCVNKPFLICVAFPPPCKSNSFDTAARLQQCVKHPRKGDERWTSSRST
jgi:hypothetical protein